MNIKLLIEGGNMAPGPALSQKLGPLGINMGQVIQKINEATKDFKGLKVPVELEVNAKTKNFDVTVFSPPVSGLLKKELGIDKGSGTQEKLQVGNLSIEQIISVAKTKLPNMLSKDLKAAVKSVIGTCVTLGVLVESKPAVELIQEIDSGKYDREIKEEKTQTPPEKKAELEKFFKELHAKQEKAIAQEAAAKEAEKAAAESAAKPKIEAETEKKPEEQPKEKQKE